MNWKERPELFANGKFKFTDTESEAIWDLVEYRPDIKRLYVCEDLLNGSVAVKDCQLIARPISDMSDEEKKSWSKLAVDYEEWGVDEFKQNSPESFLYLLSIGVLPEEEFSTEGVIWRREND